MITVICGTNRPNSLTRVYSEQIARVLKNQTDEVIQHLSLEEIPGAAIHSAMYTAENQHTAVKALQDKYILASDSFVVVSPEYNGSFPGILKTFLDAISVREYKQTFTDKKIALFGVASGRAGNLRGIDHLTTIFHHVGAHVMPKAIPYGQADKFLDEKGKIGDADTLELLMTYCSRFLDWRRKPVQTNSEA